MPLRDHFNPPLTHTHGWSELHGQWPGELVRHLNSLLPKGFRSGPTVHFGGSFEVDVATYEFDPYFPKPEPDEGGVATLTVAEPTLTVEVDLSDFPEYSVKIYDVTQADDRVLVAVIEIVSPANKDRPGSREVFVSKALTLLQQGISVSVVDLVTTRATNLYGELLSVLGLSDPKLGGKPPPLYAATLHGRKRRKQPTVLDAWYYPLTIGSPLPALPIWLSPNRPLMLPLETSYEEACRVLGMPV